MKLALGVLVYHDVRTEKKVMQIPSFEVLATSPELTLPQKEIDQLSDWLFGEVNLLMHQNKLQMVIVNGASNCVDESRSDK